MSTLIQKLKNLKPDTKLLVFTLIAGTFFWLISEISDSLFKNIIFSYVFVLIPYISLFLTETIKKVPSFKNWNLNLLKFTIISLLSFFVFLIFSPAVFRSYNSVSLAFNFAIFGFIFTLSMALTVEYFKSIINLHKNNTLNTMLWGMISYFLLITIFGNIFLPLSKVFNARSIQLLLKIIFQSFTLGPIIVLFFLYIKDIEELDNFLNFIGGIKVVPPEDETDYQKTETKNKTKNKKDEKIESDKIDSEEEESKK